MIFARPDYLHLLWAVPFLALFFYRSFLVRRRRLETMVGTALPITLTGRAVIRVLCVIGFFLFGILAAARPQWGQKTETVHRRGIDLIIALDTSYSMGADDVVPNRLESQNRDQRSYQKIRRRPHRTDCFPAAPSFMSADA